MPTIEELNDERSPRKPDTYNDDWDDIPPDESRSKFVKDFLSTSWHWRVTAICFAIGFLFHVISYGSPYWLVSGDATLGNDVIYLGLWSRCHELSDCTFRNERTKCLLAVRCFGGFPVVTGLITILLLYYYIGNQSNRRCLLVTVVALCSLSALSIQICSATILRTSACTDSPGVKLSWAITLSILAFLFTTVTGLSFLVHELRSCGLFRSGNPPKNLGLRIT